MIFNDPIPFAEAVEFLAGKRLMPTALASVDLQQLGADLRRKSLFSARTTNANYLQDVAGRLDALLSGEVNEATARAELQDTLDALDYDPARGFPGDDGEDIPPAERGTLRDLSSDKRIKLVLETNLRQAANFGLAQQGNEPEARWQYPCWELVRVYDREVPRGIVPNSMGWEARFIRAGGTLVDGRIIARKDDPVWERLGDSSLFEDGLDSPFPPFAFNSGMGWVEVHRDEAIALGVIDENEAPDASTARLFDEGAENFNLDDLIDIQSGLRDEIAQLVS